MGEDRQGHQPNRTYNQEKKRSGEGEGGGGTREQTKEEMRGADKRRDEKETNRKGESAEEHKVKGAEVGDEATMEDELNLQGMWVRRCVRWARCYEL